MTRHAVVEPIDAAVSQALSRGDTRRAVEVLWRAYGAEVFGWLVAVHGPIDAADMNGGLALSLVRAMKTFRGESSARTWLYQVARNEARQFKRRQRRQRALHTPLANHPSAEERAAEEPSREGQRRTLDELRASLDEEDRSLLVLRVDRGLSYADVARVMLGAARDDEVARGAVRLRQRVHDLSLKLRKLAAGAA